MSVTRNADLEQLVKRAADYERDLDANLTYLEAALSSADKDAWAASEAAIELETEIADFSPALKRDLPAPRPFRFKPSDRKVTTQATPKGAKGSRPGAPDTDRRRILPESDVGYQQALSRLEKVLSKNEKLQRLLAVHRAASGTVSSLATTTRPTAATSPSSTSAPARRLPSTPAARAAVVPFSAFLLLAAWGLVASPTPANIVVGTVFVAVGTSAGIVAVWIFDRRWAAILPVTTGASLPVFTVLYLASHWLQPGSIQRSIGPDQWEPIQRIGDAALLSLTMSLGGSTLGTEVEGPARVIAFIQILLTPTLVVVGLLWAWRQLTRRIESSD